MKYEWLDGHLLGKPGVEKDYKPEWSAERYLVRGKMFVMRGGDKYGAPIMTFKLAPELGQFLRAQYPGQIVPGYYMNKDHWNSLYLEGTVPDEIVRDMADRAHEAILASFSQKARREILGA